MIRFELQLDAVPDLHRHRCVQCLAMVWCALDGCGPQYDNLLCEPCFEVIRCQRGGCGKYVVMELHRMGRRGDFLYFAGHCSCDSALFVLNERTHEFARCEGPTPP